MDSTPEQKSAAIPYVAVSLIAGATFGIIAIVGAPGIAYAVVAIIAGLGYSLVRLMNRRRA